MLSKTTAGNAVVRLVRSHYFRLSSSAKVYTDIAKALEDIKDGSQICFGGFGLAGVPENLIKTLTALGPKNLTCVTNTAGTDDFGVGMLIKNNQVKRLITSYLGGNKTMERAYLEGRVELEMTPQGTLAEKLRCGGAGVPAFYTRTGADTIVERGGLPIKYREKVTNSSNTEPFAFAGAGAVPTATPTSQVVMNCDGTCAPKNHPKPFTAELEPEIVASPKHVDEFNGVRYLRETALICDYGFVKAWKGDTLGNLVFHGTAQNFNPDVAKAGRITIAEVEHLVQPGELSPQEIQLPGIYINRIVQGKTYERRIEVPMFSDSPPGKIIVVIVLFYTAVHAVNMSSLIFATVYVIFM